MLQEACEEYVSYMKENNLVGEIRSVPLKILREFLIEDVEYVRPSDDWVYSDNIAFEVEADASFMSTHSASADRQRSIGEAIFRTGHQT
jgi:hypothetical protein